MFKGLFQRLLSVYFIIMIISFVILGGFLFGLLGDYATTEKEEVLYKTGEKVNEMMTFLIDNNNPLTEKLYQLNLEAHATNTQSLILITDQTGSIYSISNTDYNQLVGKKLNKWHYEEVLLGKNIKRIGPFEGIFDNTILLTVGVPLMYKEEIIGTVFLLTPIPEINRVRFDVFKLFIVSGVVAVGVALVLIFFLSLRISIPLQKINKAAKTIADGQFEKRVDIVSQDEIGELAITFNHMAESLQNLEEMRSSFVANVSHELRTPMTTISGFVEGILDDTIPQTKQKDYLNIVLDEIRRLSRLVNNLLDLAKMEAGQHEVVIQDFDINELLRTTIIKFENRITKKDIHIKASFENEKCQVKGDVDSIQRVITNLFDNAIKFTEQYQEINVSVKLKGKKVYITIRNNGIGIPKEDLRYIWDRFYKADKSRGEDKKGTGLGLAIVKNIINQHEQDIWIESEVDKYTQFTFTLDKGNENNS